MNKKEIRFNIEKNKKKKQIKEKLLLISGIIIFTFAIFQLTIIITYLLDGNIGHNKIVLNDKVVTTEVCTQWFDYIESNNIPKETFYYNDGFKKHPIPKDIVIEVCNKWEKVKEEMKQNE